MRCNENLLKKISAWLPVLVYCLLIFYLSSQSHPFNLSFNFFPHIDKLMHFIEFALLSFLIARALSLSNNFSGKRKIIILTIFLTIAFGASDEIHQMFVPMRDANFLDILADGFGAAVGQWIYLGVK